MSQPPPVKQKPKAYLSLLLIARTVLILCSLFIIVVNVLMIVNNSNPQSARAVIAIIASCFNMLVGLLIICGVVKYPEVVMIYWRFLENWVGMGLIAIYTGIQTGAIYGSRDPTYSLVIEIASYSLMGTGALFVFLGLIGGETLAKNSGDQY